MTASAVAAAPRTEGVILGRTDTGAPCGLLPEAGAVLPVLSEAHRSMPEVASIERDRELMPLEDTSPDLD